MWMVNFGGGWQPASDEAIVFEWIRQGMIGPSSLIRHASWPNPQALGSVPTFQQAFAHHPPAFVAATPAYVARPVGSARKRAEAKLVIGGAWGFGMLIVFSILLVNSGSSATLALVATLLGVAGIATLIVGKFVPTAPPVVRAVAGALAKKPILCTAWSSVLVLGGSLGFMIHRGQVSDCKRHVTAVSSVKVERESYDAVMRQLNDLKKEAEEGAAACDAAGMSRQRDGLREFKAEMETQIAAGEEMARKALADQRAADAKAAAQAKETNAIEIFPARSQEAKTSITDAATKAGQGKWLDAEAALDSAHAILSGFKGTSVEKSDTWSDLTKQIGEQRKRIQPQLDRIAKEEDAKRTRAAEKEKAAAEKEKAEAASRPPAGAIAVSAMKLWADYNNNEVSADNAYKNKKLFVTGSVAAIEKDLFDNIIVWLDSPNEFMRVMAKVEDSEKSKAAALSKGDGVRLLCKGGTMILGSPTLKDCTIR